MDLKLCYIWVENYRNFQNTGLNFSSDVKFQFDVNSRFLTKQHLESLPDNFFGDRITEVTGLIGKNGSGKSNALELVCKLLKGGKTALTTPFLVVIKENSQFACYVSNFNKILTESDIEIKPYDRNIDPLKIVYFSNVFDERVHNFDRDISDISNNYRYPRNRYPYTMSQITTDFEKQVRFINSEFYKYLDIQTPTKIRVSSKLWQRNYLEGGNRQMIFLEINKKLPSFFADLRNRIDDASPENKFYYLVVYVYTLETINIITGKYTRIARSSNNLNPNLLTEGLLNFMNELKQEKYVKTEDIIQRLLGWMNEVFSSYGIIDFFKNPSELDLFSKKLGLLYNFRSNIPDLNITPVIEGSHSRKSEYFIFDFKQINKKRGIDYFELFYNSKLFIVDWISISSGYKAYLNIFSLIYFELRRVRKQNALICIDEGDLYLHPQWQIEFFDKLINVLPKIYSGNIQLILTSHSPFLLSDLPKQNVTIIDSCIPENSTMDGIDLDRQTFAGNIYNLYAEPFFLGNNRTSIFAKKKILRLLRLLDKDTKGVSKAERERLMKEINLIGDDVIRLHLLKKLKND